MLSKTLDHIINSIAWRLVVTSIIVGIPVIFNAAWTGAAYINFIWDVDFIHALSGLIFFGLLPAFIVILLISYPVERWIIRDRAQSSLKWVLVRFLYFLPVGALSGLAMLGGIRLGLRHYPPLVESVYFVGSISNFLLGGILYTFIERAAAEVRKRETELKTQIQELRVEINAIKRKEQVSEIVETEFFKDLQTRAGEFRARRRGLAAPDTP